MPIVTFQPSGKKIEIEAGMTLYEAALQLGLPVASSCSAEATCGKCNMVVLSGAENLSPQTQSEIHLLSKERRPLSDRISCLAQILGDCVVTTRYW